LSWQPVTVAGWLRVEHLGACRSPVLAEGLGSCGFAVRGGWLQTGVVDQIRGEK
jgi:hypothetical protein